MAIIIIIEWDSSHVGMCLGHCLSHEEVKRRELPCRKFVLCREQGKCLARASKAAAWVCKVSSSFIALARAIATVKPALATRRKCL